MSYESESASAETTVWLAQMQSCNSRSRLSLYWQHLPIYRVGESFHDSALFPARKNAKFAIHVHPRNAVSRHCFRGSTFLAASGAKSSMSWNDMATG